MRKLWILTLNGRAPSKSSVPHTYRAMNASSASRPLTHRLAVPPLPPERDKKSKIAALSLGERGDRKAVGEGSL
jgi:hypothetical protein